MAATRSASTSKLPPCEDSFQQQVKRASWQTKTWTSAHLAKPEVPSTVGHGWKLQEGVLIPVFFEGPTALDKLQDFFCGCMGIARCSIDSKCPCRQNGVACSEVCRCEGDEQCSNPHKSADNEDSTSDGQD